MFVGVNDENDETFELLICIIEIENYRASCVVRCEFILRPRQVDIDRDVFRG